tara:strand:- start:1144 stop:2319 length:1176 start_codon:yes stop_codon:yes gene_type:complete
MTLNKKKIFLQIKNCISKISNKKSLYLHNPYLNKDDSNLINNCIKTNFVSNKSKFVFKFENEIKKITKSKYAIATNTGTAALSISLRSLGVEQNDEVITSAVSFVATANAIKYLGAIPHFVDINENNLGIDCNKLKLYLKKNTILRKKKLFNKKTKRRISCIMPTHVFGFPADIEGLMKISKDFNLPILEDASEAVGSYFKNKHLGTFGKIGVLSFNGNKIITTGGGGAILTNSKKISTFARHIASTSKKLHKWDFLHDKIGWNYIMPGINASLGCSQIKKLRYILKKKRSLSKMYKSQIDKIDGINYLSEPENSKSNYWLNTIKLQRSNKKLLTYLLKGLNSTGYQSRPIWKLLPSLVFLKNCPKSDLTVSKKIENCIINIPSGYDIYKR